MAETKTKPTEHSVDEFLAAITDESRRRDAETIVELLRDRTGEPPVLWGSNLIGFGAYRYRYASGHSGETFLAGFAPRENRLTLYLGGSLEDQGDLLARLGRHRRGKSCLHLRRLSDVDRSVLLELISVCLTAVRDAAVRDQ
ncbi:MAG: DUF1801 domain-containing protein [Capsulimonadales bacterium]|nr:DUF1801 domain-containing protein [Capsulimonadales bacterium]